VKAHRLGRFGPLEVAEAFGLDPQPDSHVLRWLRELDELGAPPPELAPEPLTQEAAAERLELLGIPEPDALDVLSSLPEPGGPEWWCLEREVHRLTASMGDPDAYRGMWPSFEGPKFPLRLRCHFVHVALAVVPFTLAYGQRLGIPREIAVDSLADVGRHMEIHRRMHSSTGIEASWWVTLSLRAEIVDLGKLQFNRFTLKVGDESPPWYTGEEAERRGAGFRAGDPCLGVHIPDGARLEPVAVEESLRRAGAFFDRYYPVGQRRVATCLSWLLDDQLAEYLPAESNIVRFQRRFELVPGWLEDDRYILQFVFRVGPDHPIERLPQRTTLERAIVAHLRAGKHWRERAGWLDLPV
jgi:hypothetical protein